MSNIRQADGLYHLKTGTFPNLVGSRAMVMHKTAYNTSGNLTAKDLKRNKHGRIVSRKMSNTAKKEKRLENAGFFAKKGKFGYIRKSAKRKTMKNRK
jgi:hypothetical protein